MADVASSARLAFRATFAERRTDLIRERFAQRNGPSAGGELRPLSSVALGRRAHPTIPSGWPWDSFRRPQKETAPDGRGAAQDRPAYAESKGMRSLGSGNPV